MYSKRAKSKYRTHIRRKRLIFFAVVLVVAGGVAAAFVQTAGRFTGSARVDRKALLQLWESGSYDEVFYQTQAALDALPMDYFLLTMRGFSAYQLGISQINSMNAQQYFDDCIWSLRRALLLKNSEHDGRLYYVLGKAYRYKGDSYADLSVKNLEKARELSYNAADIPEYLGLAYASIGDYRSSVASFAEALVAQSPGAGFPEPSSGERSPGLLLFSIARSYFALDEFEQARAYLQRCIDVSPDSRTILSARLMLSEILRKAGDNDGARKQLMDILVDTDGNAEAHYQLGELYALQGESVRARAEWRLALRVDPMHQRARTRLSM
ncbi:MAG: tetratricopeptide repeat protein [Treponema sp.]|nr:tetratricopeptide repeat protein [Treponema sp.]